MQRSGANGATGQRLLIVANRLPVNVSISESGEISTSAASGGLVSGLQALSKSTKFQWFGSPGADIHRNDQEAVKKELETRFSAIPVFLEKHLIEDHYNGFSNSTLWPLLHNMPSCAKFDTAWSQAYIEVNKQFADIVASYAKSGDRIWIHDYHFMLVPRFLRDRLHGVEDVRIGFFLHTPFASKDAFAILPLREAICDGLLSCDLMGFHIRQYVDTFLDSAAEVIPGVKRSPSDLHYQDRKLIAEEFPIGIDPDEIQATMDSAAAQATIAHLRESFRGRKMILGIDRLDYIKGIPLKLQAFDKMLTDNPEWKEKIIMVQLCIPTRSTMDEYKKLRHEVEGLIGRINGKHGTLTWTPIQYLHAFLEQAKLYALYAVADICIVSSIRDGLNLVSYEYVASQDDGGGVLMLSQYTGAAQLLTSAVQFNPWDTPRFSQAIIDSLNMSKEDRAERMRAAKDTVNSATSEKWGLSFLKALQSSDIEHE